MRFFNLWRIRLIFEVDLRIEQRFIRRLSQARSNRLGIQANITGDIPDSRLALRP